MKISDVIELAKKNNVLFLDLKFVDLMGSWQHTTLPSSRLNEALFESGVFFDGSSIRGWQPIFASDMIMLPDASTAKIDPFYTHSTLNLICSIYDPISKEAYSRDPRNIARKAENYLKETGLADTAFMGPEAEFFVFDNVRYDHTRANEAYYFIDSEEAWWNSGKDEKPNLAYKTRPKEGYFPVPPLDKLAGLRQEMMLTLEAAGIETEVGHHEVAAAGQCEIGIKFKSLTEMADDLQWFKYVIKNVALRAGKTATFMPKPLFADNGSGMHTHQSLWKNGQPLFAGSHYAGLSQLALYYIGGIMKHAKALAALTNPSTNSYRRLVPGFEAPVNLAYSSRNRSASIRIPVTGSSPKAKRIEVRFPDSSCNPYLAFSAMLMAGIDGIQNKIDPGHPVDKDIYSLSSDELKNIPQMPSDLDEALHALEADHEFLLRGGVFTQESLDEWVSFKRKKELDPIRMRPTPYEFFLYYDV